VQRDEAADAPATAYVIEEPQPGIRLEELVTGALAPDSEPEPARAPHRRASTPALRTARIVALDGRNARIAFRQSPAEVHASVALDVELELVEEAAAHKDAVLVESDGENEPVIVGVLQTRRPREVHVTGEKIVIEGSREVLLRSGRAALRLREDGDIEIVGSRISAASRGLFRLVGRILRLN